MFGIFKSTPPKQEPELPLVAVIDDEVDLCQLMALALREREIRVEMAHDGESGLALIRKKKPALVLLDIMMPRMNGLEVLAQMRQDPELETIPVFVLTSVDEESVLSEEEWAQRLNVRSYVAKPFEPEQLVQRITEELSWSSAGGNANADSESSPDPSESDLNQ